MIIVCFNWTIIVLLQKRILGHTGFPARSQYVTLQIVSGGARQAEGRVKAIWSLGGETRPSSLSVHLLLTGMECSLFLVDCVANSLVFSKLDLTSPLLFVDLVKSKADTLGFETSRTQCCLSIFFPFPSL